MKIFPAVHYSMGGLWVDYEKNTATGGLVAGSPRNQRTNIPNLYAIGECDYQYHGANRLGANSLLSCIFSGLFVAPGIVNLLKGQKKTAGRGAEPVVRLGPSPLSRPTTTSCSNGRTGGENPYLLHQELGNVMTKAATVVRRNDQLAEALAKVNELAQRVERCSLSDTGNWTNQNVVFTKACATCSRWPSRCCWEPCNATNAAGPTSSRTLACPVWNRPTRPSAAKRPSVGATSSKPTRPAG